MKNRQYNSFEEIDQQLKIYTLKKEINVENIKFSISNSKNKFYKTFFVDNITGLVKKIFLSVVVKKIFKYFRK